MKIIKLPAILSNDLDLEKINQQLRDRTAQLDWSSVVSASESHLAVLLSGLDLSDDADVLGDATLSDTIGEKIVEVLNKLPEPIKPAKTEATTPKVAPAVWQQADHPHPLAPSPIEGEGGQEQREDYAPNPVPDPAPLLPAWEKGLGGEEAILQPPSYYQLRAELEQAVLADLLGPAGGEYEEVDEARVSDRYLVGLLAPLHRRNGSTQPDDQLEQLDELAAKTGTVDQSTEQLDELAVGGTSTIEDGTTETTAPVIETMFPSSMGMSFCVSGTAKAIMIKVAWGQYDRAHSEYLQTKTGAPKTVWRRYPIIGQSPPIVLKAGAVNFWQVDPERNVYVRGQIRAVGSDWIISLFLVTIVRTIFDRKAIHQIGCE